MEAPNGAAPHAAASADGLPGAQAQFPALLSIRRACAETGVSRTKIYELLSSDQLVARKIGRSTRVTGESLTAYLGSLPKAKFGAK